MTSSGVPRRVWRNGEPKATTGVELIAAERERQISVEGYIPEHDDAHDGGELKRAAACYLTAGLGDGWGAAPSVWPFESESWKLGSDIANLVKAGALIAAEIDRLQRRQQ